MQSISEAIDTLRAALLKDSIDTHVQDAFNHIASCLVLLNSPSPSIQMIRKLCAILRQPFLPLYNALPQPTLQLSSSVLSTVLGRLCDSHNRGDDKLREAWDATAKVILAGVLDFLDQRHGVVECDGVAWKPLYHILCEFFFPNSRTELPEFSVPLCLSAYNTLTEATVGKRTIQNDLRHMDYLGGERLGSAISRTRDYLLLEALLALFARLLPPVHNSSQGKVKRTEFVKDVLGSPKLFKCNEELLHVMQNTSSNNWDEIAARLIDALARSDITYPQPFTIDDIDACGRVFPQPLATDRLILDHQAFIANIITESNDICESLQVSYTHIRTITIDSSVENAPKGKVLIMVYLTSPPLVADIEMKPLDGSDLRAKFLLRDNDVSRFMEALRRRGVGKLSFLNPLTQGRRKRKSISIGSGFKLASGSSPMPPTVTFEGKVEHVNQVYKTFAEDSTTCVAAPAFDAAEVVSLPMLDSKPANGYRTGKPVPDVQEHETTEDVSNLAKRTQSILSVQGTSTQMKHGRSDELSEISEFESDNEIINGRVATELFTLFTDNQRSKGTGRETDRMSANGIPVASAIKKSAQSGPKNFSHAEDAAQTQSLPADPLLILKSSIFSSSSSTQIAVSPQSPPNAVILASMNGQKKTGTSNSDTERHTPGKQSTVFSTAENGLGKRAKRSVLRSAGSQNVMKDASIPPKAAGGRRKRETFQSSGNFFGEVDADYTPPRKKSRAQKLGAKDSDNKGTANVTLPIPREKIYAKTGKGGVLSHADPATTNLDENPGTRRSSRIKKRQTAATRRSRARTVMHGKEKKQTDIPPTRGTLSGHKSVAANLLQDSGIEMSRNVPPPPASRTSKESPLLLPSANVPGGCSRMKLEARASSTPETPKTRTLSPHEYSPLSDALTKQSRQNLNSAPQILSDATHPVEEQFDVNLKAEGNINDQNFLSELHIADDGVERLHTVADCSAPLEEGTKVPVKPSQSLKESTRQRNTITIDLTIEDSSPQEKDRSPEIPASHVHSAMNIETQFKTSVQAECITVKEPTSAPSPRHRRRSVTFASPIEDVLDQKAKYKAQARLPSRESASPSDNKILSSLRGNHSPYTTTYTYITGHDNASPYSQIATEVEIQDIVDVLNEIHSVIIKGVSDRFRNVKKDVQHGRDELIQRVLAELKAFVVENAKCFNGLVCLEGDYFKSGKAITRRWEDLINCNDGVAAQLHDALKEHDQNICTRTFPKSLLPLQPVFPRRGLNA